MDDFEDIEVKGFWHDYVETGKVTADEFLHNVRQTSRDNNRTPFQWDAGKNAGFTAGTPWFKINPNYTAINSASQVNDPKSIFNYYRQLIKIRHDIPTLTYGTYRDLDPENESVYAYTRTLGTEKYLVIINFKEKTIRYSLPKNLSIDTAIIESSSQHTTRKNDTMIVLTPWHAGIYKVN